MDIHWSTPAWMWPLLFVMAAGAVVWTVSMYRRTQPSPTVRLRRLLILLRSLALVILVLAVAGPVLVHLWTRLDETQVVIVLEDSASMALADDEPNPDEDTGPGADRWSRALTLAARIDSTLAGSGRPVTPVIVRGNGLEGLQELRLSDPVIPAPTGYGTDLGGLLADVAAHIVGRPVRAVVLLSDGQETSQQAATTSERGRRQVAGSHGGTPQVFAADGTASVALAVVGLGDPTGPADRILKDLRYPDTAFAGDEVVVELAVTHRFATEQDLTPVTARLFDADGRLVREATTEVTAPVTRMELAFIPQGEGLQVYRLELSDLDNERFHQNNEASLAINVAKERSRLLLLAARPGWDVRFLAQSAQQEQRLALSIVYRGADGLVLADSTGRAVAWQPPATAAQWLAYDGVILTDWSDQGAEPDWTTLSEAVDQGLGLLVLPGVAVSGESGRAVPPPGPLAELLPVTSTTWRWFDEAYVVVPPAETAGHPLRSGADGRGDLGPGLALLPPLREVVPTEVRTEALTLLAARRQHGDAESTRYPLLVAGKRQQGRIVFFAGRRLWELAFWDPAPWSSEAGRNEQPARRLMRNLLVWTASGEQEAGLALVGRRAFFQEGERIRLAARWRDIRGGAVTDRGLTLALWPTAAAGDSTRVRTFGLTWSDVEPGLAEVTLPPQPAGAYTLQLIGQGDPPVIGPEEAMVVTAHNVEQTQVRQDRQRLRQLAATAGGQYFDGADAGQIDDFLSMLADLDYAGRSRQLRSRLDPWSTWPFLLLVTLLLAVEWWLRRRHGLL